MCVDTGGNNCAYKCLASGLYAGSYGPGADHFLFKHGGQIYVGSSSLTTGT